MCVTLSKFIWEYIQIQCVDESQNNYYNTRIPQNNQLGLRKNMYTIGRENYKGTPSITKGTSLLPSKDAPIKI